MSIAQSFVCAGYFCPVMIVASLTTTTTTTATTTAAIVESEVVAGQLFVSQDCRLTNIAEWVAMRT